MANNINQDLYMKVVRLISDGKLFHCLDGFGCATYRDNTDIGGHYLDDIGTMIFISGDDVQEIVEESCTCQWA